MHYSAKPEYTLEAKNAGLLHEAEWKNKVQDSCCSYISCLQGWISLSTGTKILDPHMLFILFYLSINSYKLDKTHPMQQLHILNIKK